MAVAAFPPPPDEVNRTGDSMTGDLLMRSTDAGGLNTFDSTSSITIQSYQKAQELADDNVTPAHFGEGLRLDLMHPRAKNMIAWRDCFTDPDHPKSLAWIGAHHQANDVGQPDHNHISLEVTDTQDELQTRLEIPYGLDKTRVRVVNADLVVHSDTGGIVIGGGSERQLQFSGSSEQDATKTRWAVKVDATTEAGGGTGSDFRITRFDDSGTATVSPVFIRRVNSRIGMSDTATVTTPEQPLHVQTSNGGGVVLARSTVAADTSPAFIAEKADTAGNLFGGGVTGEAIQRFRIGADGALSWGPGNASRDTTLFRSAAATLRTDGSMSVGGNFIAATGALAIGVASPGAGAHVERSTDSVAVLGRNTTAGGNNSAVFVAEAQTTGSRLFQGGLQGDAVKRISVTADGKIELGDGTASRDTNLYRSAAATLKTDQALHVGATFRHLGSSLGFYNAAAVSKPTATGSRGGNAALASVLTALANLGLITDSTTA